MASMKNCKACGREIAKSAKMCPNCGAKQGGIGKIIGIAVAVIVVLGIIGAAAGGGDGGKDAKIDNSGAAKKEASKKTGKAETEEKSNENGEEVVKVGGSFEAKGLKVTVNDADLKYKLKDDKYGLYKLDDGYHYVKVDFTFENTADSGDKFVSISDFDCYADNTKCEQQYVTEDTGDFVNANLSSGRNVSFSTLYAVPDGVKSLELEYTSNIWTDEKVFVKLK